MQRYRAYGGHRPRRRSWRSIVSLTLLSIVGLIGISAYRPLSTLLLPGTATPTGSAPLTPAAAAPTPANNAPLRQVANGLTVTAANPRVASGQFRLTLCYDRPDSGNWLLRSGTLQLGSEVVEGFSATPIETRDPPVDGQQRVLHFIEGVPTVTMELAAPDAKAMRCDELGFGLLNPPSSGVTVPFTLTLSAIQLIPDAAMQCAAYLPMAQAALEAQHSGVVVDCQMGPNGAEVSIASKPDTLSLAEAQALALSEAALRITGPWVFTGSVP